MGKRITIMLDDDAADLLLVLAGSPRKQGELVSELIRTAARKATPDVKFEAIQEQVERLAGELDTLRAGLKALERVRE